MKKQKNPFMKINTLKSLATTYSSQYKFLSVLLRVVMVETIVFILVFSVFLTNKYKDKLAIEETILKVGINRSFASLASWVKKNAEYTKKIATNKLLVDYIKNPLDESLKNRMEVYLGESHGFAAKYYDVAVILIDQEGKYKGKTINFDGTNININGLATVIAKSSELTSELLDLDLSESLNVNRLLYSAGDTSLSAIEYFIPGEAAYFLNYYTIADEITGKIIGMVIYFVDMQDFNNQFANMFKSNTGNMYILSYNGMILGHPYDVNRVLTPINKNDPLPSISKIKKDEKINTFKNFEDDTYIYYANIKSFRDIDINFDTSTFYFVFTQKASEVIYAIFFDVFKEGVLLFMVLITTTFVIIVTMLKFVKELNISDNKLKMASYQLHQNTVLDSLTGLYNRFYFDELAKKLNNYNGHVSVILCDIDGLKLMNDAFGHLEGDLLINRVKIVLKGSMPFYPVIRIGGDEFVIVLQDHDEEYALKCKEKILSNIVEFNIENQNQILPLSISLGVASNIDTNNFYDIVASADKTLYKDKSKRSSILRKESLDILLSYLHEIKPEQQFREGILETMCCTIASYYQAGTIKNNDLNLLIHYYDLGRVTMLSVKAEEEVLSYNEAGYRIAMYLPEISGIADLILKQVECYDGSGKLGLKGQFIPVECRIFYAVRFFDENFVKYGYDKAIEELNKRSSSFFDPEVVKHINDLAGTFYTKNK